jgi:hypothetical protein
MPDLGSRILLEIPITTAVLNHYSHVSCSFADLHFYFVIWLQKSTTPLSEFEAVDLVKDTFASAAERDIYTGDAVEIVIINREGVRRELMDLKRD